MSRHIYHWSKVKMTEREVKNNTMETQTASKIEDILVNTKNCMKNIGVLKKILLRYWYTPITHLEIKEQFIENYFWKFEQDLNNSWLTAVMNNICINIDHDYITQKDFIGIKQYLHNMWVQLRKWGSWYFAWAILCWWYMEHLPKKRVGNSRLKCFQIDALQQPEELTVLLNRGYVLVEARITTNEIPKELLKNCVIERAWTQQGWNINKVYNSQKNWYDSTHYTNIYYNKRNKSIQEIWKRWHVSIWNNIEYPLKDWFTLIKKGCIRSDLILIWQSIE